jgi:phenylalanine-4-hydroxylase
MITSGTALMLLFFVQLRLSRHEISRESFYCQQNVEKIQEEISQVEAKIQSEKAHPRFLMALEKLGYQRDQEPSLNWIKNYFQRLEQGIRVDSKDAWHP